ncbi:WXG100 family type VII secretion target [Streptomyces qinglanensis]|uniref:WXG100 family type VII secretion target n=1 Tax=Streptomyces qinglanensis TaxID=943816 RepID=UPI000A4D6AD3|nr:WXG100 family type VII secretion target [Streptomyces qinglanensis]
MGDKGEKNKPGDPGSGDASADGMPKDAPVPFAYNPLLQPEENPLLPFTAAGPLLLARNAAPGSRTDFEQYRFNQMKDLVDHGVPQELEDVGEALWDAARAIRDAERELKTYFDEVDPDWEGETKEAFDAWGTQLRKNTHKLSEYAGTVGSHLKGAGIGLAMVQHSMPERNADEDAEGGDESDTESKAAGKSPKDDPKHKHGLHELERLSSYYRVALQNMNMAEKDLPVFEAPPNVGIPPARRSRPQDPVPGGGSGDVGPPTGPYSAASHSPGESGRVLAPFVPEDERAISRIDPDAPTYLPNEPIVPGRSVATGIDSAPLAPVEPVGPSQMPPTSQPGMPPSGPPNGPVVVPPGSPPPVGRVVPPTGRVAPQPPGRVGPGTSGPQRPYVPPPTNTGRTGQTGPTGPAGRQPPMRPGPMSPGTTAPTGRDAGRTGPRGLGRPGPMGVPPGTAGPNAGGRGTDSGSVRASQRGGVVGGTPSRSGAGEAPGRSSRQRGTVIDGQGTAAARRPTGGTPPVNAVGSGGASGANAGRSGSGRKKATGREGVVGEPRDDESGQPLDARVAMPGGAGLVMGAGQQSSKKERRQEQRRSNNSTEAEQQRPTERRGSVPPVIE